MKEPDLASGDSGEGVVQLQTRLNAIGRYAGPLDGRYGKQTEAAVLALQQDTGLTANGTVDAHTWAAIGAAEAAAGPIMAAPTSGDEGELALGALSEDEQWRWDGEGWEPAGSQAVATLAPEEPAGHVPADGQWLWDGSKWQPASG